MLSHFYKENMYKLPPSLAFQDFGSPLNTHFCHTYTRVYAYILIRSIIPYIYTHIRINIQYLEYVLIHLVTLLSQTLLYRSGVLQPIKGHIYSFNCDGILSFIQSKTALVNLQVDQSKICCLKQQLYVHALPTEIINNLLGMTLVVLGSYLNSVLIFGGLPMKITNSAFKTDKKVFT